MEGWTLDGGAGLAKINCFPSCKITDGLRRRTTASGEAVVQCCGQLHASSVQERISLILRGERAAVKVANEQGTYRGATVSPPTVDVLAFLIVKTSFVAHRRLPPSDRY